MRFATLSLAVVLALGAGATWGQSRTVSTANMPKPGVSYISGPSGPERQETVSTGTLPTPARLYVGGQAATASSYDNSSSQVGGAYVDGGYYAGGGYYGGNYPGGNYPGGNYPRNNYPGNGYPGHDRPGGGWHDGGHDHDHGGQGHDNRPNPGNTVVVGGKSNPNRDNTRYNVAPVQDNNGRHDHDHGGGNGGGNGGWNNGFNNPNGPRPSINEPPPRAYNPGAGQSSVPLYQQPGSGPPPQIPRGASVPTRSR